MDYSYGTRTQDRIFEIEKYYFNFIYLFFLTDQQNHLIKHLI